MVNAPARKSLGFSLLRGPRQIRDPGGGIQNVEVPSLSRYEVFHKTFELPPVLSNHPLRAEADHGSDRTGLRGLSERLSYLSCQLLDDGGGARSVHA